MRLESDMDLHLIDRDTLRTLSEEAKSYWNITDGEANSTSFQPPMHSHPGMDIACNDDLKNLTHAVRTNARFRCLSPCIPITSCDF